MLLDEGYVIVGGDCVTGSGVEVTKELLPDGVVVAED